MLKHNVTTNVVSHMENTTYCAIYSRFQIQAFMSDPPCEDLIWNYHRPCLAGRLHSI